MMPVVAAITVPISVTDSASPPGTRRSSTCSACSRSFATPDFSSIVPMKMNIGTATSTRLSTIPPKMREMMLKNSIGENTSKTTPSAPKARPMPPSTMATGNPENSSTASATNISTGK